MSTTATRIGAILEGRGGAQHDRGGGRACAGGGGASPAAHVREPAESRVVCYNVGSDAGWSSLVARRAHNPKVAGSNPAPAMKEKPRSGGVFSWAGGADLGGIRTNFVPIRGVRLGRCLRITRVRMCAEPLFLELERDGRSETQRVSPAQETGSCPSCAAQRERRQSERAVLSCVHRSPQGAAQDEPPRPADQRR